MSAEQNARVTRAMIEGVLAADWAPVERAYADNAELIDPLLPEPVRGQEAIVRLYQICRQHEPDMTGQIKHVIAAAEMVAVEWQTRGTIHIPFPGMPDSIVGKRLEISEVNILRFDAGRIVHNTVYADTGAIMRQLGVIE